MPETGFLSLDELGSVRQSWWRIQNAGGVTYVDDAVYGDGPGAANAVAAWFNTAANMENVGVRRAEAMVRRYAHCGELAAQGRRLAIRVYIEIGHPGTFAMEGLDTVPPEVELAAMIDAQVLEVAASMEAPMALESPALDALDQDPPPMAEIAGGVKAALLAHAADAARVVGQDLTDWAKGLVASAESVDSWGDMVIAHWDRLICYLDNVDDQAFVYLDGKLLSARSYGQKGAWDTAEPLAPGSHLLVVQVKNFVTAWSYRCLIGRLHDYRQDGPKRPYIAKQDGRPHPGDGNRQVTRTFFVRITSY